MMTEISTLIEIDKNFFSVFKESKCIPNGIIPEIKTKQTLYKPYELFDPNEPELCSLLDGTFFPSQEFQREDILAHLRIAGLHSTLDWSGIISCAKSIESLPSPSSSTSPSSTPSSSSTPTSTSNSTQTSRSATSNKTPTLNEKSNEKNNSTPPISALSSPTSPSPSSPLSIEENLTYKQKRGLSLLDYLIKNISRLIGENKKPQQQRKQSIFSFRGLFGSDLDESSSTSTSLSTEEYLKQLTTISWMPIRQTPLDEFMPWNEAITRYDVIPPRLCRPSSDAWLCSYSLCLSLKPIQSDVLIKALGWSENIPIQIIATQLRELAIKYNSKIEKIN